jgi:hypothetical protein
MLLAIEMRLNFPQDFPSKSSESVVQHAMKTSVQDCDVFSVPPFKKVPNFDLFEKGQWVNQL